jgi:hypothetical protein
MSQFKGRTGGGERRERRREKKRQVFEDENEKGCEK